MNMGGIPFSYELGISKEKGIVLCILLKGYLTMWKKLCIGLLDMKIADIRILLKLKRKALWMKKMKDITLNRRL